MLLLLLVIFFDRFQTLLFSFLARTLVMSQRIWLIASLLWKATKDDMVVDENDDVDVLGNNDVDVKRE